VDTARAEIVQHHHVHLGFAAQTDRGLMVPVVHDADRMTTAELSAELARLTDLARTGSLPPAALTGGTFTLNKLRRVRRGRLDADHQHHRRPPCSASAGSSTNVGRQR